MSQITDYPVTFRGRRAVVQAAVRRAKRGVTVSIFSLRFEGERDERTFSGGASSGEGQYSTAFDDLEPAELLELVRQVRAVRR